MADEKGADKERRKQSSLDAFSAIRDAVVSASGAEPNNVEIDSIEVVEEPIPLPTTVKRDLPVEDVADVPKVNKVEIDDVRGSSPVRTFQMPSSKVAVNRPPTTDVDYHDLDELCPDAPVPMTIDGMVFHRASLHELGGVMQLLNWVSEGDAVIVELSRIISRDAEFSIAIEQLSTFIEGDIGGQIIQLTDTRLLLLPPGCKGISGIEIESFATET